MLLDSFIFKGLKTSVPISFKIGGGISRRNGKDVES